MCDCCDNGRSIPETRYNGSSLRDQCMCVCVIDVTIGGQLRKRDEMALL